MRKLNWKKAAKIASIVVAFLLLGAVVTGVLNALVADGQWSFGWSDYNYDDSDYQVGDGTIVAPDLSRIELDWIDGKVQIVVCDDANVSVTEHADSGLTDGSRLHWHLSEDGKTLSFKYRASSKFFGSTENKNKDLILRIPRRLLVQLESLDVNTVSTVLEVKGIRAKQMRLNSSHGSFSLQDCVCGELIANTRDGAVSYAGILGHSAVVKTEKGNITLTLPGNAAFTLHKNLKKGSAVIDFPVTERNGVTVCGNGTVEIRVTSAQGDLCITQKK